MKIKTNMFFWRLNNDFANILQKVRSFRPIVFQSVFIRGWYFVEKCLKNGHFQCPKGSGHLLEHGRLLEILRYTRTFNVFCVKQMNGISFYQC